MKFSVIMPTYNCSKYIKTAILSVLDQYFFNDWELIIIDDGSTDNTEEIVRSYCNSKIKYLKFDGPHCQAFSWQKGLEVAQGKILGFLDADDWLHPMALYYMYRYYEFNPETICAWSQNNRWDENLINKVKDGFSEDPYKYGTLIEGMLKNKVIVSHFLTCRKDQIDQFDVSLTTSADRWLALEMDLKGKLGFYNKVLHRYRFLRPNCITLSRRKEQINNVEKILNQALEKRNDSRRIEMIVKDNSFDYEINIIYGKTS